MKQTDHLWYRIRYAFWIMQRCGFQVTPAFAWDCATSCGWEDGGYEGVHPTDAVDEEIGYWEADE